MSTTTRTALLLTILLAGANSVIADDPPEKIVGPVRVKIQDEKPIVFEPVLPVDPVRRVEYQAQQNMSVRVTVENRTLHLGFIYSVMNIDDQIQQIPHAGQVQNLPKTPGGKDRDGYVAAATLGKLRITQTVEVVPTRTAGGKQRRRDSVLVRYSVENKDTVPHRVGLRSSMDVFVVDNDGALFAASNQPGKILDGVVLAGKMVPDYLQMLQRPNLNDPGFVAHLTFKLGNSIDRPSRIVLTSLGGNNFPNNWNPQVVPAMGDSAMSMFWDLKEIKPGGKRDMAYAIGQGIAADLEGEGSVKVDLSGSFEPGKLFTVNAFVSDPAAGQNLTLDLPPGLELLEGRAIQPVPAIDAEGNCLVQWRARVVQPGQFALRVHSSTGTTQTKIITITPIEK